MMPRATTLILGWGNPGRVDDGLGPAFIEALSKLAPPGIVLDSDYQLTVENAAEVARYDRVLFVDADRRGPAPFTMQKVEPSAGGPSFSTHSVAPGAVLSLCRGLFDATPDAWLLGIRGYEFDRFGEGLSLRARANLDRAVDFIRTSFEQPDREGERCPTPSA
jgi:hydrogenase maturation protease